jgi:hypothetical protein
MGVAGYVTERAWSYSHCGPFSGGLSRDGTSMSGNKAAAARASVDLLKLAWAARQCSSRTQIAACDAAFW